jgi:LSD1 subclass zinc finger protein
MQIESLNCNHCGAPLEVPQSAKFIRCNHCGSQLVVHRSESATFTEKIEQLTETTENLAAQVSKLTKQSEVDALDRQWDREKEKYMEVTDKHGAKHLPTKGKATAAGCTLCVGGAIWTIVAVAIISQFPDGGGFQVAKLAFPVFGVAFFIFGIVMSMKSYRKAQQYEQAYRRYRQRRDELLR